MDELARLSERLVVMSESGRGAAQATSTAFPTSKIDLIPHGIPHVPSDGDSKDRLGVEGKTVILTFGLLSPDKGIEYVIDALPAILARPSRRPSTSCSAPRIRTSWSATARPTG